MKKNYTHIVFILDGSGSMREIQESLRLQLNDYLAELRNRPGQTIVDVYQYSDVVEHLVHSVDLSVFRGDILESYHCSGHTALYDAGCLAVDTLGEQFNRMDENERPDRVFVVFIGDGVDNVSTRYKSQDLRDRVLHQTYIYSWQFLLGLTKFEAKLVGDRLGISQDNQMDFEPALLDRLFDFFREHML
ncbi:MAG: VWA domain-containing protein [Thermoguttaceae bacterium]|nr:VWA domain-containing protein [Thermoguttaceae bacterium]